MEDIGQLMMVGVSGLTLTKEEKKFIRENNIGGIILFSHNYESPAQLAELVNAIQALRKEYPLLIAVDHEGGRVIRFKSFFTQFPPMGKIGELGSEKVCFDIHKIMAMELRACGINLNFSPCCDILKNNKSSVIGDRAFGSNFKVVSNFITEAIKGLQTNGIIACAKHFPGHGSTSKDSHLELPTVKTSIEDLKKEELIPFVRAIQDSKVEMIMMGHLMVDSIDDQFPTSLSKKAHDILRNDLKYSKIIISDDMEMQAITDNFKTVDASIMALNAGTDILLFRSLKHADQVINSINKAILTKKIGLDLINNKFERIISCKKKAIGEYRPIYIPKISKVLNDRQNKLFVDELNQMIADINGQKS